MTSSFTPIPDADGDVWTYRGYHLKSGEFNTAMVHFYRGEITRSNVWRTRLDSTTNWAVVTTGAVLTFAFSSVSNPPVVILISFLLVGLFWLIESRRYRYYELWALRVRLMETDFFAAMLTPPFAPHQEWAVGLADSLLTPAFPISYLEALGRRLRRNYIWLFLILGLAWVIKLMLHPEPANSLAQFLNHAAIGPIPGNGVALGITGFFIFLFTVAVFTASLQNSAGEVLPHTEVQAIYREFFHTLGSAVSQVLPADMPFIHRHQQLAIIITGQPEAVSQQLLSLLKRGVTRLQGQGMYTGEERSVLLCAVAPDEVPHLKGLVYAADEHAFVVVNLTEDVFGKGFENLEPAWRRSQKPRSAKGKEHNTASKET
jgi:uncharacterized membrane protein